MALKLIALISACTVLSMDAALLRQSPLLMTHDSGTGYIGVHDIRKGSAMTQTISLENQLSCGARVLDMRLFQAAYKPLGIGHMRRRIVRYHHGKVPAWKSDQSLDSTLQGLVDWAGHHPTELVLFLTSHTYHANSVNTLAGDGDMTHDPTLMKEVRTNFEKFGVRWEFDCNKINGWTLDEAMAAAKMENGGMMIVLDEQHCIDSMYDGSIDSRSKVQKYVSHRMSTVQGLTQMFTIQSLIQESGIKVPLDADLNHDVLQWIGKGLYDGVNMLEVNTVCAYGPDISSKLGAKVSGADINTCRAACEEGCKKYGGLPGCAFKSLLGQPMQNATVVV